MAGTADIWEQMQAQRNPQRYGTAGLDPTQLSYGTTKNVYGDVTGARASYGGPGGTFSNVGQGWSDVGGRPIGDLPGYLKMKGQQQTGADFGGYQNQLLGLLQDPSKIQQTAGYQFAKGQGEQAINRSAAAKGMLGSGNVLAELQKYGTGLASQEYGTQVNRLADLMRGAQQFGVSSGYYDPMNFGYNPKAPGNGGASTYTSWA